MVYNDFKTTLLKEFETQRDLIVIRQKRERPESLFGIAGEDDRLYMQILSEFEKTAIRNVENLVKEICSSRGIYCELMKDTPSAFDMVVEIENEKNVLSLKDFRVFFIQNR